MSKYLKGVTVFLLCALFAFSSLAQSQSVELELNGLTARSKERIDEIKKKEKVKEEKEEEKEIKALFDKAEELYNQGSYKEAKKLYMKVNRMVEKKKKKEVIERKKAEKRAKLEAGRKQRELEKLEKEKEKAMKARQKALGSEYIQ